MANDPTKDPHLATWQERRNLNIKNMRCPQCGKVGYKPYVHPDGQIVAEACGRCDHESSCGYHVPPREWLKDHPVGDAHYNPQYVPPPPPPAVKISPVWAQSMFCLRPVAGKNPLLRYWVDFLRTVNEGYKGIAEEYVKKLMKALRCFLVGTMPGGYTVWWIMDERGDIRSGKAMKYKTDGHRDKEAQHSFLWVHTMPEVKAVQKEGAEYVGCLFGLHQMKDRPEEVHIVESEKTAVLMTMFKPNIVWMATMGLGNLNEFRLAPLIDRGVRIVCHPDYDGFDKWTAQVAKLRMNCPKAHVEVSDYIKKAWMPGDSPQADILDIMERDYQLLYR